MPLHNRKPNIDLLRIHAEDAAFVATQRSLALEAPNYRLIDIYDLEQILHGHLDALMLAGGIGADIAKELADNTAMATALGPASCRNAARGARPG